MKITRVLFLFAVVLILGISLTGYSSTSSRTATMYSNPIVTSSEETHQPTTTPEETAKHPEPVKAQPSPQEMKILSLNNQAQESGHFPEQNSELSCVVCHISASNTTLLSTSWSSCGACHSNPSKEIQVGKEVLHPQYDMIQGLPISTIPRTPSYKYAYLKDTFSCTDCHVTTSEKHDFLVPGVTITHDASNNSRVASTINYDKYKDVFRQAKCAVCHPDPQNNVESTKIKQAEITKKLDQLRPIYLEWTKKLTTLAVDDPKVIAFKNGATFFTFVENDGSKGAHNFNYSKLLLSKTESYWKSLNH